MRGSSGWRSRRPRLAKRKERGENWGGREWLTMAAANPRGREEGVVEEQIHFGRQILVTI